MLKNTSKHQPIWNSCIPVAVHTMTRLWNFVNCLYFPAVTQLDINTQMTTFLSEVFKERSAFRLPHIPLNASTHPHQAWAVIKSKLLKHPHHRLRQILLSVGYGLNVFRQSRPRRLLFCFHFSALLHFLPWHLLFLTSISWGKINLVLPHQAGEEQLNLVGSFCPVASSRLMLKRCAGFKQMPMLRAIPR